MSEFKFACPICGQHITADSKDTGSQIGCPTCYRKIVVPPAPASAETKFVISASEANKPRPTTINPPPLEAVQRAPEKTVIPPALIILLVLACASGATLFLLRDKIFHAKPAPEKVQAETVSTKAGSTQPEYTGTNRWTLDLSEVDYPDSPVSGSVHHRAFELDRATLNGSNLTLRAGRSGAVELGVNIIFFNRQAEELSGKTAEVKPTDAKAPRVVLHWKDGDRVSETFKSGYAMKVEFGPVANNGIPGKIFLCLPDSEQSWVAGTFHAEIRKPSPPKQRAPAGPKTQ